MIATNATYILVIAACVPSLLGVIAILASLAFGANASGPGAAVRLCGIALVPASVAFIIASTIANVPLVPFAVRAKLFVFVCAVLAALLVAAPRRMVLAPFHRLLMQPRAIVPSDRSWEDAVVITTRFLGGYFAAYAVLYAVLGIR